MKRFPLVLFLALAVFSNATSSFACRSTFASGTLHCETPDGKTRLTGEYQDIGAEDDRYNLWVFHSGRTWDLDQPNVKSEQEAVQKKVFFDRSWYVDDRPEPAMSIFFGQPKKLSTQYIGSNDGRNCAETWETIEINASFGSKKPVGYHGPAQAKFKCRTYAWFCDEGA